MALGIIGNTNQPENSGGSTTCAITLDFAVAVGDYIDLWLTWGNGADEAIASIDDDLGGGSPNAYNEIAACRTYASGNNQLCTRAVCLVTQAGTPTITVTYAGSRQFRAINATGIREAASVDQSDAQLDLSTTTPSTPVVLTDTDGELILSVTSDSTGGVTAIAEDATLIFEDESARVSVQYEIQATAGNIAGTWTFTGTGNGHSSVVTYRPAAGGGSFALDDSDGGMILTRQAGKRIIRLW